MGYQTVFKRYEMKYLLSTEQKNQILEVMAPFMTADRYGRSTIRNIYYDTDTYRLIRQSIEKPAYKEKLRIRSYEKADADSPVFAELKKKYQSVVYKRRMVLPAREAEDWLCGGAPAPAQTQIAGEIDYFCRFYAPLRPAVFLSYEREAYYAADDGDFRVTFDENILCRREALSLGADVWGMPLLDADQVLMEIKTAGGIPLWMTHFLTEQRLSKTSFSKYGAAYQKILFQKPAGGKNYA